MPQYIGEMEGLLTQKPRYMVHTSKMGTNVEAAAAWRAAKGLLLPAILVLGLAIGANTALPPAALAQTAGAVDFDDEQWRFSELERLLYEEEADARLQAALGEMQTRYNVAERNFRLSGLSRLDQFDCPAAETLGQLDPHVDPNVTTARLYRDYGRYFLCIRQYDDAIAAFSSAIPLYRAGFGREALVERSDPAYLSEVRVYYDEAIAETMRLMESAGALQSYARAQAMTEEYWPQRLDSNDNIMVMRGDVLDAWEEALQLLDLVGMNLEADDARQMLRTVLTFDQAGGPDVRQAR